MFYTYHQNNSGGSFDVNNDVALFVIIEASSAKQANALAQAVGLYFGGNGDCRCCGDRWYEAWGDEEGDEAPTIYGKPAESENSSCWVREGDPITHVYYLNGTKKTYRSKG